jgi:hypothetical protein
MGIPNSGISLLDIVSFSSLLSGTKAKVTQKDLGANAPTLFFAGKFFSFSSSDEGTNSASNATAFDVFNNFWLVPTSSLMLQSSFQTATNRSDCCPPLPAADEEAVDEDLLTSSGLSPSILLGVYGLTISTPSPLLLLLRPLSSCDEFFDRLPPLLPPVAAGGGGLVKQFDSPDGFPPLLYVRDTDATARRFDGSGKLSDGDELLLLSDCCCVEDGVVFAEIPATPRNVTRTTCGTAFVCALLSAFSLSIDFPLVAADAFFLE